MAFFAGMPSEAAGPVRDSTTPTWMSAMAGLQDSRAQESSAPRKRRERVVKICLLGRGADLRGA
jgi:hypothetical protein